MARQLVKTLFALMHALRHEVGMDEALRMLHLPLEGTHHRAGDDAWNIALILAALLGSAGAVAANGSRTCMHAAQAASGQE